MKSGPGIRREFEVKYELGHSHKELWHKTDAYCPHCAKQDVWEANEGDYYEGPEFFCATCSGSFRTPRPPNLEGDWQARQRLEGLGGSGD